MTLRARRGSVVPFALMACLVGVTVAGAAAEWPTFTPGRWQFDRTVEEAGKPARTISATECVDPTAKQREQRAVLTKAGCQFTPVQQVGTTFRYSATCRMGGVTATTQSVLEARSGEAYTITVDSVTDGVKSHEVLTARRLGHCER